MSEQFEKDLEILERLRPFLEESGFVNLKVIEDRGICGLQPFMFTVGLTYGIDHIGWKGRWCYPHENAHEAVLAFHIWDGKKDPLGNWIKHKGIEGEWENPRFLKKQR